MSERNVATVRAMYEAFGRGDVDHLLDQMADDVEWETGAVDHGLPLLTPGRGRQHVARFFEALGSVEFKRFEPRLVFGDGDHVLAVVDVEFLVPATGRSVAEAAEAHLWTFGPDGRVTAFRHYADTLQHAEAWGD
jgi:ketosteroid isomerase-like protein